MVYYGCDNREGGCRNAPFSGKNRFACGILLSQAIHRLA